MASKFSRRKSRRNTPPHCRAAFVAVIVTFPNCPLHLQCDFQLSGGNLSPWWGISQYLRRQIERPCDYFDWAKDIEVPKGIIHVAAYLAYLAGENEFDTFLYIKPEWSDTAVEHHCDLLPTSMFQPLHLRTRPVKYPDPDGTTTARLTIRDIWKPPPDS